MQIRMIVAAVASLAMLAACVTNEQTLTGSIGYTHNPIDVHPDLTTTSLELGVRGLFAIDRGQWRIGYCTRSAYAWSGEPELNRASVTTLGNEIASDWCFLQDIDPG